MEPKELIHLTEATRQQLRAALGLFGPENVDVVPFEGSWSPGEVAEHMLITCRGVLPVLNGPTATAGRRPDEKLERIRQVFLDFSTKMKSPLFGLPKESRHDLAAMREALDAELAAIGAAAGTHQVEALCEAIEFPVFGSFTGIEWIAFINYHTQRHCHQLEAIAAAMGISGPGSANASADLQTSTHHS